MTVHVTNRTDGIWVTVAAVIVGLGAILAMGLTASEARAAVLPLMVLAGCLHVVVLIIGSTRLVAVSTAPMIGAIVLESGFADEPSWIRSIVLGCWWFVAMELSWEAIDRRGGAEFTSGATRRRLQEVVTVVGMALAIGMLATMATSLAPARSVVLQAVVLGGLLAAFVWLVRHTAANEAA